jgi:hypothetical protein
LPAVQDSAVASFSPLELRKPTTRRGIFMALHLQIGDVESQILLNF